MADLFAWLLSFLLLVATLAIVLYQDGYLNDADVEIDNLGNYVNSNKALVYKVMCLSDLELDYINPYDSASQINKAVLPEFVTQGSLCLLHLLTGHWLMFLICLPHSYYNFRLYTRKQHLVDVTEIFNQLPWEKQLRIYKLVYLAFLLFLSIFWYFLASVSRRLELGFFVDRTVRDMLLTGPEL